MPPPRRTAPIVVALALAVAPVPAAPAPPPAAPPMPTRLARDEPEILLAAGGRNGVADVAAFTPDGKQLLVVGEDKVVHRWGVRPDGLDAQEPLYWNTFRERRGAIYALAQHADPAAPRVAVAGFGKRDPDVAVIDPRDGSIVAALSPFGTPGYGEATATVWSLAFSADGTALAVGDDYGNVWHWRIGGAAKKLAGRDDRPEFAARVAWVGFLPDGRVAYSRRDGAVRAIAPEGGKSAVLFRWNLGEPQTVVASRDGRFLAATPRSETADGSAVEVRSIPGGALAATVPFPRGRFPVRAALSETGARLAVGVADFAAGGAKKLFAATPPGAVEVYDLAAAPRLAASKTGLDARPDALAFAPGAGSRLATAGGDDHATAVWDIVGAELKLAARDAGKSPPLWGVRMSADGRVLAFQTARDPNPAGPNGRGAGPWNTFDLQRGDWCAPGKEKLVAPLEALGGWTVAFRAADDAVADDFQWYAVAPDGTRHPLPLSALQDDRPQCYTFLPGAKENTVRLAVGHLWGITVYTLADGKKPKVERKLTGHVGFVTSVAPALGGRALVSCGRDQVVAFWSLADFASQPILGAKFQFGRGTATVEKVDAGSPAEEAGLSPGDVVTKLGFDGDWVAPADWEARLTNPAPMKELAFVLKREGVAGEPACKTLSLHRPVARFAPFKDGEWVMVTYRQCYFTCSTNGDHYVRWLVSKARASDPPQPFRVEQFPGLRRPEKVADVVGRLVREPCEVIAPDRFPPDVKLELAANQTNGANVNARVTLTPRRRPDGTPVPVDLVELVLNGHHRVAAPRPAAALFAAGTPVVLDFVIPAADLRSGDNTVEAIGTAADAGYQKSGPAALKNLAVRGTRRLFGLVAGINTYQSIDGSDLRAPVGDAKKIFAAWTGQRGRGAFTRGLDSHLKFAAEQQVTRETILEAIRAAKDATPDDLFVLFLAGHGIQVSGGNDWFYVIPYLKPGVPVRGADWRSAALQDETLLRALTDDLKCQPVVFLDCCQSGAAGQNLHKVAGGGVANQTRSLRSHGFGPVVFSACSAEEKAWEDEKSGGFFAGRIARALGGDFAAADADGDGQLTAGELFASVRAGVAADVKGLTDEEERPVRQTPQVSPPIEAIRGLTLAGKPGEK